MFDLMGVIFSFAMIIAAAFYLVMLVTKRYERAFTAAMIAAVSAALGFIVTMFDPNDGAADIAIGAFNVIVWTLCTLTSGYLARKSVA